MIFSTPIFLFLFLPVVLTLYFFIPKKLKNLYLLVMSLLFYFWGQKEFVLVMIFSIIVNYILVILIDNSRKEQDRTKRLVILILGIQFNIGLLILFKYLPFLLKIYNPALLFISGGSIQANNIQLVAGISFYTFHAISYIVDVYRGEKPQKNIINSSLYIALFPQLVAGPIIRYHTIASQLIKRKISVELFSSGIERFIIGLAKKVLIANSVASVVDPIFSGPQQELSLGFAWLGIIAYTLQIYFDFSGYSDMAIGLGRMFGFTFMENFNYPYISQSITEFWRRWHISLSSWFRDYVYIPLGGNRKGNIRTYSNLFTVFILCGLWHGANWNFLAWGIWYGLFLVLEKSFLLNLLNRTWRPLRHLYTILIIVFGWVLFRSPNLHYAMYYFKTMFNINNPFHNQQFFLIQNEIIIAIMFGIIFIFPLKKIINNIKIQDMNLVNQKYRMLLLSSYQFLYIIILFILLLLSSNNLASSTYNPFIYYRF